MMYFWIIFLILTIWGPCWILATKQVDFKADYRTANRDSTGLAPQPHMYRDAVIQAYAARAWSWRGVFASHTWLAVKPKDADYYIVYQVMGWRGYYNLPVLAIEAGVPDRYWYNSKPKLLLDIRGEKAQQLIPKVDAAARSYPYPNQYTLWPGPNSNTLPAYVGRKVPELRLALPSDAIGKDFLPANAFFARAPSGTGFQLSLGGVFGITLALKEGIELNFLGFTYGIGFAPFGIKLPGRDLGM